MSAVLGLVLPGLPHPLLQPEGNASWTEIRSGFEVVRQQLIDALRVLVPQGVHLHLARHILALCDRVPAGPDRRLNLHLRVVPRKVHNSSPQIVPDSSTATRVLAILNRKSAHTTASSMYQHPLSN